MGRRSRPMAKTPPPPPSTAPSQPSEEEQDLQAFSASLHRRKLTIRDVANDGNCFFRAVSDQLYGSEQFHDKLRQRACDYLLRNKHSFKDFIDDEQSFDEYVADKRNDGVWADNLELQAISMACGVNIRVHQSGNPSYDIRNHPAPDTTAIHISYHFGEHYASVRPLRTATLSTPAQHAALPPPHIQAATDASGKTKSPTTSAPRRPRRAQESQNALNMWKSIEDKRSIISSKIEDARRSIKAICTDKASYSVRQIEAARKIEREMKDTKNRLDRIRQTMKDEKDSHLARLNGVSPFTSHTGTDSSTSSVVGDDEDYDQDVQEQIDALRSALDETEQTVVDALQNIEHMKNAVNSEPSRAKGGKKKEQDVKRKERKERRRREQESIGAGGDIEGHPPALAKPRTVDIAI